MKEDDVTIVQDLNMTPHPSELYSGLGLSLPIALYF